MSRLSEFPGNWDPWWLHEDEGEDSTAGSAAFAELHRIEGTEAYRRDADRKFVRYYGDPRYNGFSTVGVIYPSPNLYDESSSNENVIRRIVTTQFNKFSKNKPVPTVVTMGGTYREQAESEEREEWIRGVFQEDKSYALLALAQFHSMICGDGFIGMRDDCDTGRPVAYPIAPWEIHVDPPEANEGKPRTIFRVGQIAKEVFAARYPKYAEHVWRSTPFFEELWNVRQYNLTETRQINFLEAWHLPSSKKSNDGRHLIAIPSVTLENEEWDFDYFPLVRLPWNPRPFGYFSVGLIEDLIGPQRQLNKTRNAIDEHLKLMSASFWAVARGSNVVKSALSNLIGRVIEYSTTPPELKTPDPVSPALVAHQADLRNQIFGQSGVSQMSAHGQKPAGLNSGKALRVYADQEDQNFANAYLAKEIAVVELAELYCKRAQAMLEQDADAPLSVRLSKDSELCEVAWKDAELDSFRVQVLPASALSTTLAGKLEDVQDLESLGMIADVDQKRQLLQIPDLKADSDLSLAPRNLILKTLQDDILKHGNAVIPEPFWNIQTCATLGLQMLCFAQLKKYPEHKIQLLRNWNAECVARMQPPPSPPTPPAMPGAPMPSGPTDGLPVPPPGPMEGAVANG